MMPDVGYELQGRWHGPVRGPYATLRKQRFRFLFLSNFFLRFADRSASHPCFAVLFFVVASEAIYLTFKFQ